MEAMGMNEMKEGDTGDVGRFLNRLLGLKILNQNMVSCIVCQIEQGSWFFATPLMHIVVRR